MSVFTNPASGSREHARADTEAVLDLLGDADPLSGLRATGAALRGAVEGLSAADMSVPEAAGSGRSARCCAIVGGALAVEWQQTPRWPQMLAGSLSGAVATLGYLSLRHRGLVRELFREARV